MPLGAEAGGSKGNNNNNKKARAWRVQVTQWSKVTLDYMASQSKALWAGKPGMKRRQEQLPLPGHRCNQEPRADAGVLSHTGLTDFSKDPDDVVCHPCGLKPPAWTRRPRWCS